MSETGGKDFMALFRREAGSGGAMSFERFMELALYAPELGYYRRDRRRVGRDPSADFYTSTSLGPVFGELVAAAAAGLLRAHGVEPREVCFVELGAEPGGGVLSGVAHGFAGCEVRRLGEPLDPRGPCVVFSNELFDAQPCRRLVRRDGVWRELGVRETGGALVACELAPADESWLPAEAPEGYVFDAPRAAARLAGELAAKDWRGLFLAFDYGKSFEELAHETPGGTVRAYWRHTQEKDLHARPGEQDLTCHVCWDWIADALRASGFGGVALESQETFFVRRAGEWLARQVETEASKTGARKGALLQLLHPAHLGRRFQVLHAWRG